MKAKWKQLDIGSDLPCLTIESGPTISEIYSPSKHLLRGRGVLIIGVDGPSPLKESHRDILRTHLEGPGIPAQITGSFLWVESEHVDDLFERSDFGKSGDACLFISEKPNEFRLARLPRRVSKRLVEMFEQLGAEDIIYCFNMVPDLLIVSRDLNLLKYIDGLIEVGKPQKV